MNLLDNWKSVVVDNYANFDGRARRSEYWYFVLVQVIISFILQLLDLVLVAAADLPVAPLGTLFGIAMLVPGLAVAVRRLHDTGRSGWWLLVALIPILGWIYIIYLYVIEGTQGPNEYGEDPKAGER